MDHYDASYIRGAAFVLERKTRRSLVQRFVLWFMDRAADQIDREADDWP